MKMAYHRSGIGVNAETSKQRLETARRLFILRRAGGFFFAWLRQPT